MSLPSQKPSSRGRFKRSFVVVAVVLLATLLFFELRLGPPPEISIASAKPGVGRGGTTIEVRAAASRRGLADLRVEAVQGEGAVTLEERAHETPPAWAFWRPRIRDDVFTVTIGPETVPDLRSGEVTVRVTAERAGSWLRRGEPVIESLTLPVRLEPPALELLSRGTVATQGGSGVVVYRVGETALEAGGRDGVEATGWFFPGHPLPEGEPGERFALFGVPYDLEDGNAVRLMAEDGLGNAVERRFLRLRPEPLRTDTIELSDGFFAQVVPEILGQTPELQPAASDLETYLRINGDLRRRNAEELRALTERSRPAFLWQDAFVQLPGSQVTSAFADRRTYVYDGREVDRQDHLGFDLASVRQAPVPASNGGVVLLARYFGIYGNTVVVDHGYGLTSLYSHLSSIEVEVGQEVAKGETLGRTGETGLAAGDHLHFTLMIGGLPVNPIEWWDPRWVRNHVLAPLQAGAGPAR